MDNDVTNDFGKIFRGMTDSFFRKDSNEDLFDKLIEKRDKGDFEKTIKAMSDRFFKKEASDFVDKLKEEREKTFINLFYPHSRIERVYERKADGSTELLSEMTFGHEANVPKELKKEHIEYYLAISEMMDIYKKKNKDYGNSFIESCDEEGLAAARVRLGDKWNRFKTLTQKGEEGLVKDESIRDTLIDMANYAIMTVMWMDKNSEE